MIPLQPTSQWTPLTFGPYAGKTLPQILFLDPGWFFWAWSNGVFKKKPALLEEAAIIHGKAISIRIRNIRQERLLVEYKFSSDGTCSGFDLVPADKPSHQGSTATARSAHIDMSIACPAAKENKLGCWYFLQDLTAHLFGGHTGRALFMSRKRCEAFFNDDSNFHFALRNQ